MQIESAKARSRPISAMSSDWLDVVQWNRYLFDGLQHYHQSRMHEADLAYGKALACLTHATDKCAMAVNACATANPALQELFRKHHAICLEAHAKAKKDNDLVHYEKVPDIKTLPKPERKRMVKSTPPPELATAVEPTPVSRSVAAVTAQAASVDLADPPPPSIEVAESAGVAELTAMGFSAAKAREALQQAGGSVQAAAEVLLQEASG